MAIRIPMRFPCLVPSACAPTLRPPRPRWPISPARRRASFRATAGLRNPLLEPVLADLDLQLAAWTRRPFDTVNADPERVLQRLTRDLGPGDILLMHDGHAAHTAAGEPVILSTLPRLLQHLKAADLRPVTLQDAER